MSADAAAPATPAKDSAPSATPDAGQPGTAPSKPATPDAAQPGTAPTKPDASSPPPWVPPVTTVPPATTGSPGFPGVPTGPMEPPTWVPPATTVSPGIPEVPTWPTLPTRPPEVVILPVCLPETAAVFCARQGAQCGTKNALDNCGSYRSEFCGGCASGQFCDASNQCQWIPIQEPPVPICISNFNANEACRQHASVDRCKTINVRDNCGKDRDVNCANVWFPNNATCTRICPNSGCR
jgi:hypothetical protein